ncbi:DNA mismatch repair protein mutS, putative [Entamoeba dispar SAW760]|uniref:DNA mismatch repair protein mutS, putative n=1 Tax=Entamoeba dispar (strain ATCC PRA-260 / SAW760) TaxID=370354 RepID=B0EIH4_ENTDS|nr:DNA mismatch repair protein mutS, putative [Entamoeba dispar SAW760]EDR25666.1 DNA mismatch repair protein mutS, putative [Entamoeba dispar SAW760]|eukprot:EDR25666.1 DNA mismatch repair protein mutS, putative [Entamoeba dispar SAW760]
MTDEYDLSPLSDENSSCIQSRSSPNLLSSELPSSNLFSSTTSSKKNERFTNPLKTTGSSPSFLQKTPLLSKLLSNSTHTNQTLVNSAQVLCDNKSNSQLNFSIEEIIPRKEDDDKRKRKQEKELEEIEKNIEKRKENNKEEEDNNNKITSISIKGNELGIATIDIEEGKLEISKVNIKKKEKSKIDRYIYQTEGNIIITHNHIGEENIKELERKEKKIIIRPSQDFSIETCKKYIEIIKEENNKRKENKERINILISRYIPIEKNNELTKAIGGLLKYYYEYIKNQEETEKGKYLIKEIKRIEWDKIVYIDEYTFKSLNIFKKEEHPDIHSKGGGKEGISLYGCLNKCMTKGGSKLLKEWILRIEIDKYIIKERQEFQKEIGKEEYKGIIDIIRKYLKKTNEFLNLSNKIQIFQMKDNDWIKFYKIIYSIYQIIKILNNYSFKHRIIIQFENIFQLINTIKNYLDEIFNINYLFQNQLFINSGFNNNYDNLILQFNQINHILIDYNSKYHLKYCFFNKLGFLIEIPLFYNSFDSNWNLIFKSNDFYYYKDIHCIELDNSIGDINQKILDFKTFLLDNLSISLIPYLFHSYTIYNILSEFDVLLNFVVCNMLFNWNLPSIVNSSDPLILSNARNPILELLTSSSIPNSTKILSIPIQIITGPNSSGKTIYLKQVGLNVIMALIGSGVCADNAQIPLFTHIFTKFSSSDSSLSSLSSFTFDCSLLSSSLNTLSSDSLLLIDEFGKGTHPSDGLALFISTILYLQSLASNAPKTIISTHFFSIFHYIDLSKCVPLKMDVLLNHSNNSITFLYRLVNGISDSSYAIHSARLAHLPSSLISRASQIANSLSTSSPILPLSSNLNLDSYYNSLLSNFSNFDVDNGDLSLLLNSISLISSHLSSLKLKPL